MYAGEPSYQGGQIPTAPPPSSASSFFGGGEEAAAYVVYGIPFRDEASSILTRRVLFITFMQTLLGLISSIFQLVSGVYYGIGIMSSVVLPLCAFFGIQNRKTGFLLNLFIIFSFIVATYSTVTLITQLAVFKGDYFSCLCEPECRARRGLSEKEAKYMCGDEGTFRILWWVSVVFGVGMSVLQCWGAWVGIKLQQRFQYLVAESSGLFPSVSTPLIGRGRDYNPQQQQQQQRRGGGGAPGTDYGYAGEAGNLRPASPRIVGGAGTRYTYAAAPTGYRYS